MNGSLMSYISLKLVISLFKKKKLTVLCFLCTLSILIFHLPPFKHAFSIFTHFSLFFFSYKNVHVRFSPHENIHTLSGLPILPYSIPRWSCNLHCSRCREETYLTILKCLNRQMNMYSVVDGFFVWIYVHKPRVF